MSANLDRFIAAANKGEWQTAFNNLNSLNMSEMLKGISALTKKTQDRLVERRFAFKSGLNMARMEYAWTVVRSKNLPLIAPGDLSQTGQVSTAATFINKPVSLTPKFTLRAMVFTDKIVTNRTLFPELKKKAEEILKSQGNAFKLDVTVHPKDIPYNELFYLTTQVEEMLEMIKKEVALPSDKVIVLLVRLKPGIDTHGMVVKVDGKRIILIDTDTPNPDRATLLHEMGHCATLPHAGENAPGKATPIDVGGQHNVMALAQKDVVRDALTVTQGELLAKAFFAK